MYERRRPLDLFVAKKRSYAVKGVVEDEILARIFSSSRIHPVC